MALTASRTSVGFEPIYNKTVTTIPNPVAYELTPAVAFKMGDMVTLTKGKIAKAAAGVAINIVGVMAESITAAANPSGSITYGKVYDHPDNVYRCTFASHSDFAADSGTTTTIVDAALTAGTDDFWAGALVYVYAGTNAGCIRTVSAFGQSADTLTVNTAFPAAIDATSKYIILGKGAELNDVINVGLGGIQLVDENTIDAIAARLASTVKQGPLVCVGVSKVTDLMLDVMIMGSRHFLG